MAARSKIDDFDVISRLGSGSFGTVYKGTMVVSTHLIVLQLILMCTVLRHQDQGTYVMKTVRIAELSEKEQWEAINEVKLLASMDSLYVVRYYDSFISKDNLAIIMEFCNKGDLQRLIKKAKQRGVTSLLEAVVWNISLQILLGLEYLHSKKVLHRDLKSANVFLSKDASQKYFSVKIGDLGVAKLLDTSTAFAKTIVGTPYYLSPELCSDQPYRDKSDVWAFGVILFECCSFRHPFEAGNQCALILKIIQSAVPPLPAGSEISQDISSMIQRTLQKDPSQRPTVREILSERAVQRQLRDHRLDLPDSVPVYSGVPENRHALADSDPPTGSKSAPKTVSSTSSKTGVSPMGTTTDIRSTRVRGISGASATAGSKVISSSRARNIHQKQTAPSTNSAVVVNRLYPGGRERKDSGSGGSTPMGTDMSHKIEPAERDLLENLNPAPGKDDGQHDLGYGHLSDEEDYADDKFEQLDEDERHGAKEGDDVEDADDGLDFDLDGGLNLYGQYRSPSSRSSSNIELKEAERNLESLRNGGSLLPSSSKLIIPTVDDAFEQHTKSSTDSMYITLADPAAIDAVQQKEVNLVVIIYASESDRRLSIF